MATLDDVYDKLIEFQLEFQEHKGNVNARVLQLEKDRDKSEFWDNLKIVAIIPITASLHLIASKIGWIKS